MMRNTIYALGYFDGVHLGHQALLDTCRQMAQNCQCGAVTFSSHPQQLLKGKPVGLINTNEDREEMLLTKVNTVLELTFDEKLKNMPWQDFCEMLVRQYKAAGFVCGSDFRFGRNGAGNAADLQQYCLEKGLHCGIVQQQYIDGIRVSSTHIRTLLEKGNISEANRFLGHPHVLSGVVRKGKQLGRTIGIPTANLEYPEGLLALPYGVYACRVQVGGKSYTAMTNIGVRPTVSGEGVTVESHLLDFSGDLYGKNVILSFYEYLRPEYKFPDLSDLQKQVEIDKFTVEKVMQNY